VGFPRPGTFKGVTTVVAKLFQIHQPTRAYFWLEGLSAILIIKQMVNDLGHACEIIGLPIIREGDGLGHELS